LIVNIPEPPIVEDPLIVKGEIRQADGTPLANTLVRAVDKDMRTEQLLGEQRTNTQGYYEIRYTRSQFSRAEKQSADLIVRVFDSNNQEIQQLTATTDTNTPLETIAIKDAQGNTRDTPIWFNAPAVAIINLSIIDPRYRGLSEYERYLQELTPLLESIPLGNLEAEDIIFLAKETTINSQHITFLRDAFRLSQQTAITPPAFYGLFRQNLPTDLSFLLARDPQEWRSALQRSLQDNIIPAGLAPDLDSLIAQFQALLITYTAGGIDNQPSALGEILATALSTPALRQAFTTAYAAYDGKDATAFWTNLKTQTGFQNGVAETVQFTLQASTLTQNHLPLVRVLQQERQRGTVLTLSALARLDEAGWLRLLNTTIDNQPVGTPAGIPGTTPAEKVQNYAKALTQLTAATFPTVAIAARLEQGTLPGKQDLLTFFANNPDFAIDRTPLSQYLVDRTDALRGYKIQRSSRLLNGFFM
jgi:protein-tyrosine-phosphatase